ncbi:MAG: hypothetical protein ACI9W4_002736 [Rhodothermales bacterium]|jgi:hypothetical protein
MPDRLPEPSEYAPFYAGYVSAAPNGPIVDVLRSQGTDICDFIRGVPEETAGHRYAEGKWTVAEVLGHVVDTERVFGYRAFHFARGTTGEIPGMDQDVFAANAPYQRRSLGSIADEWTWLRASNAEQYQAFDGEIMSRSGIASRAAVSVRALLHIMAGHAAHHVTVLKERYI